MRDDISSRTTVADVVIAGSRNWMAPERLKGGSLRKPCDVYAFGMVIFEVMPVLYSVAELDADEPPESDRDQRDPSSGI